MKWNDDRLFGNALFSLGTVYVKGVPFFNKRYRKGVPFLSIWYKKSVLLSGLTSGLNLLI